ncbi:MAG: hypothetical protein AVDCRST_MAG91-2170, partial [uncultured Sphingomonadaceae bacterium]
ARPGPSFGRAFARLLGRCGRVNVRAAARGAIILSGNIAGLPRFARERVALRTVAFRLPGRTRTGGTVVAVAAGLVPCAVVAGSAVAAPLAHRPVAARLALRSVIALRAVVPLRTILTLRTVVAPAGLLPRRVFPVVAAGGRLAAVLAVAVILVIIVAGGVDLVPAARALLLEARAVLVEDAVIMIGELQIIFGLHPVAGELHVARHRLVLFVKLRGVAASARFGAIAASAAGAIGHAVRPRAATAATAAVLSIVDQRMSLHVIVMTCFSPMAWSRTGELFALRRPITPRNRRDDAVTEVLEEPSGPHQLLCQASFLFQH